MENYLIAQNADKALLAERGQQPGGLNDSVRRFLIGHLANYVISIYGFAVTKVQVVEFCKVVLILFPSLSLKNGDDSDTVSFGLNKLNELLIDESFSQIRTYCVIQRAEVIYTIK